jgi:ADP-ribosylglycohydrolase
MPTQELSRARAEELLGAAPALLPAPADNPISAGLPAGRVTDDTEQALVIARLLIDGGGTVDPHALARDLLSWQDRMAANGSLDLLGPSTNAALQAVRAGADPATTGRAGTTNGAAMRIAPVGVSCPPEPLDRLLDAVDAASRVTHDTPVARAAAGAVAAAVSAGVQGWGHARSIALAVTAAHRRHPELADRLGAAIGLGRALAAAGRDDPAGRAARSAALDTITERVGTSLASEESVPAAFAVAVLADGDPWQAIWFAARLGGDADTIAAMAGAVCAASAGLATVPAGALALLATANTLDIDGLAAALLVRRTALETA